MAQTNKNHKKKHLSAAERKRRRMKTTVRWGSLILVFALVISMVAMYAL